MKCLLIILCLLSLVLPAQNEFFLEAFGASGQSDYTFRSISDEWTHDPVSVRRFGLGLGKQTGRIGELRFAVQLSEYGSYTVWSLGELGEPDQVDRVEIDQRHRYLEGLLAYRYRFRPEKALRPYLEFGLGVGKYLNTKHGYTTYGSVIGVFREEGTSKYPGNRNIMGVGRLGAGLNYDFNERFGAYGMAVYQRHLWQLVQGGTGTRVIHPWQLTGEVGVRMRIGQR